MYTLHYGQNKEKVEKLHRETLSPMTLAESQEMMVGLVVVWLGS